MSQKYGWSLYFVHIYKVSPVVMTKIHSTRPSCVVSDVSNAMFPCKLQRAHDLVSGPGVGDDGDHDGEQEEARIRQEESQDRQEDDHGVARSAQQLVLSSIHFYAETSTDDDRNTLEDVLFNDEDNLVEDELMDEKFLVALRLSPVPENLVKGYEFKMLNK